MGSLERDRPVNAPASGPGDPLSSSPTPGVRRLKLVSSDPDRAAAPDPAQDWARLVRRVAEQGDREAFSQLFAHFAPRVKSYLIRTGSADALAEELAQEALVTVWRKAALFDPAQAAVSTWVFTIARHLRVDAGRRHRLDGAGDECFEADHLAADQPEVPDHAHATRQARRVREALEQLPPEQAQALRLSFYDDEPHARIAAELGLPLGTVKSRIRLAVAHLRKLLES